VTCCEFGFRIWKYSTNGSSSIMPAGIPHWVLGTSNALCVGRHFYSKSSIQSSVIIIAQTFLLGGAVRNEDHLDTRSLLYQLMVFWETRLDKTDVDGEFYLSLKQQSRSNSAQGHIYQSCHLWWNFSTSYYLVSSSSSPLLLMAVFTKNLPLPLSKRPKMQYPTSIPSSIFSPSVSLFSLMESLFPILTLFTGC